MWNLPRTACGASWGGDLWLVRRLVRFLSLVRIPLESSSCIRAGQIAGLARKYNLQKRYCELLLSSFVPRALLKYSFAP